MCADVIDDSTVRGKSRRTDRIAICQQDKECDAVVESDGNVTRVFLQNLTYTVTSDDIR